MDKVVKYSETDVAWAAGFFDGEGYVGLIRFTAGPDYQQIAVKISVDQKMRAPLDKLSDMFGGGVTWTKTGTGIWRWQTTSNKAVKALAVMLPYLIVKAEQAELAVMYTAIKERLTWQEKLVYQQDMKDMKKIDTTAAF